MVLVRHSNGILIFIPLGRELLLIVELGGAATAGKPVLELLLRVDRLQGHQLVAAVGDVEGIHGAAVQNCLSGPIDLTHLLELIL